MNDLNNLVAQAEGMFSQVEIHSAADYESAKAQLENMKAQFLGKSGAFSELMKGLAVLPVEEKRSRGSEINCAKQKVEALLSDRRQLLAQQQMQARLASQVLDVTLPAKRRVVGGMHPISRTLERVEQIFSSMGFDLADGPELESDWHSFTALNNPPDHPARSMQDTFYVDLQDSDGLAYNLRPHTSPMQVRYAQAHVAKHQGQDPMPEIRVIAPGRTYRVDNDATHSPMFHQVEGLWLGESVSFNDLKAVLTQFYHAFFETDALQLRFRPSFFPFTEPSAEVDLQFQTGKLAGRWLEVAGCGQTHPQVVRNMNLDPEAMIGFAFGMGADRLAMLRYGVSDLRQFFDGDVRFLSQFA